jgi:hypothetical protein
MKDFDFYNKKYTVLVDLLKMGNSFGRNVRDINRKQQGELDSRDLKALDKKISNLSGPYISNPQDYERFLSDDLIKPLNFAAIVKNLHEKNASLIQKGIDDSGQGTLFEAEERMYCTLTPKGKKKIKEIEKERESRFSNRQPGLFGENKMKISKKRLFEIIQEECGMVMGPQMGYEMTPDGEIDREGRMAKRQLADIAEYAQELEQMLGDETQLEAWVQAKLTKAADYIKTVKHYVEYGMEEGAYDQVMPKMEPEMPPMAQNEPEMNENGEEY